MGVLEEISSSPGLTGDTADFKIVIAGKNVLWIGFADFLANEVTDVARQLPGKVGGGWLMFVVEWTGQDFGRGKLIAHSREITPGISSGVPFCRAAIGDRKRGRITVIVVAFPNSE